VGQLPYTQDLRNVSPGAEGTAVITGHRTTSGAPFRHIDQLSPGDVIIIRSGTLEQRWEVVYSTTVAPTQTDAIRSFPGVRRLVVLACNPVFSARERLVVYSRLAQESTQ
jgi:sortase A